MTRYSEKDAIKRGWIKNPPKGIEKTSEKMENEGEAEFLYYWKILASDYPLPTHDRELPKDMQITEDRKFRPDFRWGRVILEVEGIGHRLNRYETDIWKYNLLTLWGFQVYRVTRALLNDNPQRIVSILKLAIDKEKKE